MIITYLRSSSIGTWMWCPQKYFLAYNLGYQEPSNKKADKGTICHKVFELLAVARKAELEQEKTFNDEILGEDIPLRVVDDLEWLTTKVYDYYTELMTNHEWTDADYRECFRWVKKALLYNNGAFDPRNLNVVAPESRFDIEVKQSWAKYALRGEEGYLRLKGTIDLVTEPAPGTFEIIDWKTGRRLNWATGQEKDYNSLRNDIQLRMYHYAMAQQYPQAENLIFTIFYINDGGPWSIPFQKSDLITTEGMLRKHFQDIRDSELPDLNKSWKCTKLCHFGKTRYPGSSQTMCEFIHSEIKKKGMEKILRDYTRKGYDVTKYKAPGEVE